MVPVFALLAGLLAHQTSALPVSLDRLKLTDAKHLHLPQRDASASGATKGAKGKVAVSAVLDTKGGVTIGKPGAADALGEAVYIDSAHTESNMGHLEVWTYARGTDSQQMYAAGYLEGWTTAERIAQHYDNMYRYMNVTADALGWLATQRGWLEQQLAAPASQQEPFWVTIGLLMDQFHGMVKGYNDRAASPPSAHQTAHPSLPPLSSDQLYFLISTSDIFDAQDAIDRKKRLRQGGTLSGGLNDRWAGLSPGELQARLAETERCSALVKVSPDFQDLWVGQSAWYSYSSMLRIFKHYDFQIQNPAISGRKMAFSSYPAFLSSDDDFYLIGGDAKMAVLQTTNHVFDESVLDGITPTAALSWQRVRTANHLAKTGTVWAQTVATHNSGTYMNSWLVVALDVFKPGEALSPGLLTVVEQIPGNVYWEDRTTHLESGYMALYNVPMLPQTYAALGYPQFVSAMSAKGAAYQEAIAGALWQVAPRAKIFRRDHASVTDLPAMQQLMRSNDWQNDPFSANVSTNAVCGRGDVNPLYPKAAGCYDSKVADWAMACALQASVTNGPPYGPGMVPFQWDTSAYALTVPHVGQPNRFAFGWDQVAPTHTQAARSSASVS